MTKEEELKKQRIEFLMLMDTDPYQWAVDRAYLTFCRVLDGYTKWEKGNCKGETPKQEGREKLLEEIEDYFKKPPQDFDEWHEDLASSLREKYKDFSVFTEYKGLSAFTYGCAQKWINMTFKCLYAITDFSDLLGHSEIKASAFRDCHIPIDKYVIENAEKHLKVKCLWNTKWSKLDSYDQYLGYEALLREKLPEGTNLLDLDLALWVKDSPGKVRERLEKLGIKLS